MAGAAQAFIVAEVDESERTAGKTLKRHPLLFVFQVENLFQWQAFSFGSALPKFVSSSVHESRNATTAAHTKQLGRERQQKGSDNGCTLVLELRSSFTENLLSPPGLLS